MTVNALLSPRHERKNMRKFLPLLLLPVLSAVLLIGSYSHLSLANLAPFEPQARAATGAIFAGNERQFHCSGSEIGKTPHGDGIFLTARHCVANPNTNEINKQLVVSFSDNEGGPYYDAMPLALSLTDDVALLLIRNGADIPEVQIRDERRLRGGDPIFNVSFPLGTGKIEFHGEYIAFRFPVSLNQMFPQYTQWNFAMPVNLTFAHGSSGSGIFSKKERSLIGVAVGTFSEGSYNIVIPSDRVLDFLNDLSDNTVEKFVAANPIKEADDLF